MPSQQKKYDIIIIGAGLGGLTAGAKLAKDGKKVLLLEQHHKPGGCATTFTRQGYTWDVGLHAMDGLDIDDRKRIIFKELGVFDKVTFVKAPEFYRLKNQRLDIVIPHPAQKAARLLMAKFPAEKQGIEKFFKTIHAIRKESNRIPLQRWKLLLLLPVFPFLFPNIFLYTFKTVGSFLDQEIANEDLKLVLAGNILYYHDDPYTMSFIYFAIAQSGYFEGGSHYIQGGSQRLSEYLAQVIIKNNGKILLSHLATEIITEGRQAVGVRYTDLCDGKKTTFSAYADKIIANTAVPNIVPMLHGKNRGLLKNKIKKLTRPCSLISIYIGFKREVRELKNTNYCTFLLNDKVTTLGEMKNNYRGDFAERSFFFTDYSQIDTKLVPAGRSVASIATADYFEDWQGLSEKEYQKKKDEVAHTLLQRLEQLIPGIRDEIACYEVGTPKTIQRYTLNPGGVVYGFAQQPRQAGIFRMPNTSPIKNLYFASAWTNPGGGFTGALFSGWFCAHEVISPLNPFCPTCATS